MVKFYTICQSRSHFSAIDISVANGILLKKDRNGGFFSKYRLNLVTENSKPDITELD